MLKPMEVAFLEATAGEVEVEFLDFDEEITLETQEMRSPADPRLKGLSAETRSIINSMFKGDVCEAVYAAHQHCNLYARPQQWAVEIHGAARQGWKDPARVRF